MAYIAILHLGVVSAFYGLEIILRLTGASGLPLSFFVFRVGDLDIEEVVFFCIGHGGGI
jgi:hypothetical protein